MVQSSDKKRRRHSLMAALALALAILLLAGCQAADSNSAANGGNFTGSGESKSSSANNGGTDALKSQSVAEAPSEEAAEGEVAEGGGALGGTEAASGEAFHGKIIYSANLTMRVEDLKATASELKNAINTSGGYILQFSDSRYDGEIGSQYTIKVPAQGFMSFVDRISNIPNLQIEKSLSGKDVSEEYVDLESRLKAKRVVEDRLLGMMEKASKADDLLQFSNQLAVVQEQIEQILGRLRYLDANVAYSTIELRVYQKDQKLASAEHMNPKSFGSKLSDALTGSSKAVLNGLQLLLIVFVGALPVIAVLAVVGIPIYLYVKYRRTQKGAPGTMSDDGNSPPES
ncbi:DUF4349 domain-containing protein [Paenibacillus sp. LHD-117]|uniref:DUF4349 domain-containing protein n=1 Tax=Paenibacillus sp. LHD-117 TaxID=3071412 RepID=UPI0027DED4C9|nr:DUF4349 domain-containing protein [Paenibacillus sp. LHD-117]MDQ6418977.1 DUF4349 domain-containing protein [Paenibacillus sp. LHD-117]